MYFMFLSIQCFVFAFLSLTKWPYTTESDFGIVWCAFVRPTIRGTAHNSILAETEIPSSFMGPCVLVSLGLVPGIDKQGNHLGRQIYQVGHQIVCLLFVFFKKRQNFLLGPSAFMTPLRPGLTLTLHAHSVQVNQSYGVLEMTLTTWVVGCGSLICRPTT